MRELEVLETINVRGAHGQIYKIRVKPSPQEREQLAAMKVPATPGHEFAREMEIAELLRRYQHPYVIRFLGTGIPTEETFILMDLHTEGDLDDLLTANGPLSLRESLDILIQVAEAIHFLHGLGIYHRDIKAENIVVTDRRIPKVTDFGTAHLYRRRSGLRIPAREGRVPARQADRRRDALMLGEVLYHALTGRKIYDARLFALAQRRRLAPAAATRLDAHYHPVVVAQIDTLLRRAVDAGQIAPYSGVRFFLTDLRRLRALCDREQPKPRTPRRLAISAPPAGPGFLDRAAAQAWDVAQREPENAAPWIHLGNAHLVALRASAAERAYTQALHRDPANYIAQMNLAFALAQRGEWDRALHLAITAAGSAPRALRVTARARYVREGRHLVQDAVALYSGKDRANPYHRLQLGYGYDAQGDSRQALQEYQQALALDPQYAAAAEALAFLYLRTQDPNQALVYARRAVAAGEERAEAWLALGSTYLALDQPEDASVALARAVDLDPNHPYCLRELARAWLILGDPARAEEDCRHAVRIDPCWTEARLAWGDALAALGRVAEAHAAYAEAIRRNPECLDADGQPGLTFALAE